MRRLAYLAFAGSLYADMATSVFLLGLGYVEHNPLFHLLGEAGFWTLYVALNAGLMVLIMLAERRYWWAPTILTIPIIAHLICAISNLLLI